jgi:putative exporter of polyketide antibiotics
MPLAGPAAQRTNSKAIWALVLGLLSIVMLGIFTALPAILLGSMAKKEIAISGEQGRGMARAGFIVGIVVTVLSVLALVLSFVIISTGGI